MSYAPNVEAVVWFFKEIWPVLREHMQALSLSIVGADPGPTVRALGSHAGINVTGTVPDVRSYYEGALAAIVPLRSGAGTRLKILEAMAAGVPVISTSLGAEGLEVEDKIHLLIADDVPAWTDALEWVADEARRRALTTAARELVVRRYDWEFLGQKLVETYTNWCTLRL
jgi:glycosyltransferase involved in cell wall biosynthesis